MLVRANNASCLEQHVAHQKGLLSMCCVYVLSRFSRVQLFATPCTTGRQAPLFMGFSRQEYWSGLPFPPPGIFPTQDPGMEPGSPASEADFFFYHRATREAPLSTSSSKNSALTQAPGTLCFLLSPRKSTELPKTMPLIS